MINNCQIYQDNDRISAIGDSTEDGEGDSTEDNDAVRDSTEDGENPLLKIVVNF